MQPRYEIILNNYAKIKINLINQILSFNHFQTLVLCVLISTIMNTHALD
jgi:hypothetical protein